MQRSTQRRSGWLLASLLLAGCQLLPHGQPPEVDPELAAQLTRYLRADDQQVPPLLDELGDRSPAELEAALRGLLTGASFWRGDGAAIETGLLPSRPVRVGDETLRYGLYVPPSYRPDRAYPLIICLHGAGFGGDSYLERWQPRLGEDYILACPSIEDGAWWTREGEALVLAVLDEVGRRYHVDLDRVFLTGMSNGGLGAFLIGLYHTDRFAALVPMAAPFPRGFYPLFENARETPIYLIHGVRDQVIPVFYSRHAADFLQQAGYSVVYQEHTRLHPMAGGHFFPKEELPELVAWLSKQTRRDASTQVVMVRDRDHPGRDSWVRLEAIDPDIASFWASEQDEQEGKRLEAGAYARLAARVEGNQLWVETRGIRRFSLLFPSSLVDFSQPVRVMTNGQVSFYGMVTPDSLLLLEEARRRPDPAQLVMGKIDIEVP